MDGETFVDEYVLAVDEFVRRLLSRGRGLHWLAGAGVSLSAGVPTATDLSYDFKRSCTPRSSEFPSLSSTRATPTCGFALTLSSLTEVLERHFPMRVLRYRLRQGSGGAGRHPGGEDFDRVLLMLEGRNGVAHDRAAGQPPLGSI